MKQSLYCVYDSCAKLTMPPFSSPNDDCAKRDFVIGSIMAQKPIQDLQLWRIADVSSSSDIDVGFSVSIHENKELINPTISEIAQYKESCKDFLPRSELMEDVDE